MTTTTEQPAVTEVQTAALARLNDAIEGLRALRNLVLDRPDIAAMVDRDMSEEIRVPRILVYVSERTTGGKDIEGWIAALGIAALERGATIERADSDKWRALDAKFGFLKLHIYTDREAAS